jgi:hypothetical protein
MNRYERKMRSLPGSYYPPKGQISLQGLPLSTREVEAVEDFMGCKLPPNYLEFLSKYGGYGPNSATFPIEAYAGGNIGEVSVFFGAGQSESYDLLDECKTRVETWEMPRHLLPIAVDGMGCIVFLSLSGADNGYVYYWDINDPLPENGDVYATLHLIAKSFDEFIESLRYEEA